MFFVNINDYLKWRGDLSFKVDPFNEVDNLIFAELAYIDYSNILGMNETVELRELSRRYFELFDPTLTSYERKGYRECVELLAQAGETERFGSCVFYDYEYHNHENEQAVEQFAAITADLPDGSSVIAFRGTDDTLIGWKEDLMLSYRDIASQYDALDYVNRHATLFHHYRFLGHSKGGYLALYSAVHCKKALKNNILEVYSNDGPGLMDGTYDEKDYADIAERYQLIVPEKCGVGTIYEMPGRTRACRISVFNIVSAHSIFNWLVEGTKIVEADKAAYSTDLTRKAIEEFMTKTSPENREKFIDELFRAFDEAGIRTLLELQEGGTRAILNTVRCLRDMDQEAKDVATLMLKAFSGNFSNDLQHSLNESAEALKDKAANILGRKEKTE